MVVKQSFRGIAGGGRLLAHTTEGRKSEKFYDLHNKYTKSLETERQLLRLQKTVLDLQETIKSRRRGSLRKHEFNLLTCSKYQDLPAHIKAIRS